MLGLRWILLELSRLRRCSCWYKRAPSGGGRHGGYVICGRSVSGNGVQRAGSRLGIDRARGAVDHLRAKVHEDAVARESFGTKHTSCEMLTKRNESNLLSE